MAGRIYWSTDLGQTWVEREGHFLYVSADCGAGFGVLDLTTEDGFRAAVATRDLLDTMLGDLSANASRST